MAKNVRVDDNGDGFYEVRVDGGGIGFVAEEVIENLLALAEGEKCHSSHDFKVISNNRNLVNVEQCVVCGSVRKSSGPIFGPAGGRK